MPYAGRSPRYGAPPSAPSERYPPPAGREASEYFSEYLSVGFSETAVSAAPAGGTASGLTPTGGSLSLNFFLLSADALSSDAAASDAGVLFISAWRIFFGSFLTSVSCSDIGFFIISHHVKPVKLRAKCPENGAEKRATQCARAASLTHAHQFMTIKIHYPL